MISILSFGTALIIYCPNIWTLYLCSFATYTGGGAWDNANNIWLIEMWQETSPTVLQLAQFMYGLGCILGPLLMEPFVTGELKSDNVNVTSLLNTLSTFTTLETITTTDINETIDRRTKLKFPFITGGALQLTSI
jgi:MFS family permease